MSLEERIQVLEHTLNKYIESHKSQEMLIDKLIKRIEQLELNTEEQNNIDPDASDADTEETTQVFGLTTDEEEESESENEKEIQRQEHIKKLQKMLQKRKKEDDCTIM